MYADGVAAGNGTGKFTESGTTGTFGLDAYISQYTGLGPVETCPTDLVVPLSEGQTFTIPFSEYCVTLHAIGLAGNGLSMVAALMIVFGGSSSRKD